MNGINLLNLETGQYFRTLLTDRVGKLLEKEQYRLRVKWNDLRGPGYVHRNLVVEPWPRDDEGPGGW